MKKIVALLLVLVMSFTMFSCELLGGVQPPVENPDAPHAIEPV